MVQKDVVSKFSLERSYRIIYPGFDGEISVLAPLKRGGGGYPWYPVWRKCYSFNWLKNCTGLIIFCYTKFGRIFTLVKGWHASREKLSWNIKLTWNIKEILNHWIIESCRSFYLFIYLFLFWENNFSFPIHRQKLIVSKLRYKRIITQIRTSNLNHRSRIGNRSKLPSKKKKRK